MAPARRRQTERGRGPVPVGAAIAQLARDLGIHRTLRQYDVLTSWESIVGEGVARVAKPERIDGGVLYVTVATAPWRAELAMRKGEILGKVASAIGKGIIKDIRFR